MKPRMAKLWFPLVLLLTHNMVDSARIIELTIEIQGDSFACEENANTVMNLLASCVESCAELVHFNRNQCQTNNRLDITGGVFSLGNAEFADEDAIDDCIVASIESKSCLSPVRVFVPEITSLSVVDSDDGDDSTPPPVVFVEPTNSPTRIATAFPTLSRTNFPTVSPTKQPTTSPTKTPTAAPTKAPTAAPTLSPTKIATQAPTKGTKQPAPEAPTESPVDTKLPFQPTESTNSPTAVPVNQIEEPSTPESEEESELQKESDDFVLWVVILTILFLILFVVVVCLFYILYKRRSLKYKDALRATGNNQSNTTEWDEDDPIMIQEQAIPIEKDMDLESNQHSISDIHVPVLSQKNLNSLDQSQHSATSADVLDRDELSSCGSSSFASASYESSMFTDGMSEMSSLGGSTFHTQPEFVNWVNKSHIIPAAQEKISDPNRADF